MKKYKIAFKALSVLLLIMGSELQAQNIKIQSDQAGFSSDTIAKMLLDLPQYRIYYEYLHVQNPKAKPLMGRKGITLLLLGKERYNMHKDYTIFRSDSILDVGAKQNWPSGKALNMGLSMNREAISRDVVLTDRKQREFIMEVSVPLVARYTYKESAKDLKWQLVPGDSVVSGYKCKKATTTYRGRSYVAWYTEEIDMPYGPYKFIGLPGLVMKVGDTQRHHTFTFVGMTKATLTDLIYSNPRAFGGKREWIRKGIWNFHNEPAKALEGDGRSQLTPEEKKDLKKTPYNPIELE